MHYCKNRACIINIKRNINWIFIDFFNCYQKLSDNVVFVYSDNFGLLTTTSTSYCGNDVSNPSDFQHLLNEGCDAALGNNGTEPPPQPGGNFMLPTSQESQLLSDSGLSSCNLGSTICGELGGGGSTAWDSPSKPNSSTPNQSRFKFSFPVCEPTIATGMTSGNGSFNSSNGSSNASADSPTQLIGSSAGASGSTPCSFNNQWNSSDVSSLMVCYNIIMWTFFWSY